MTEGEAVFLVALVGGIGLLFYLFGWDGILLGLGWLVRKWRGMALSGLATVGMRLITGRRELDLMLWGQGILAAVGLLAEMLQFGLPEEEESPPEP